ncbi:four helix bundle protein [Lactococcus formosensis]|uniref:four helix bundle protein n=1 Tax=Lactococcus formosensis TaxID=1281486 RepID=UPI0028916E96|nr:four helix bundle protein [Lactococcus formosensis]MDT2726099.1 four helix bundle protein [Lactococcus formosensis]
MKNIAKPKGFELAAQAKLLLREVLKLTSKGPKKYRFSLFQKMETLALDILQDIYEANNSYVAGTDAGRILTQRINLHVDALAKVNILGTLADVAVEYGGISKGEFANLTKLISSVGRMLGAWHKSDRLRYEDFIQEKEVTHV